LKLQPGHPKAMRVLRELFVQTGDYDRLEALYAESRAWEELSETLLTVAERSQDPALRLKLNLRVAEIGLKELRQPERAAKAYERILATDPQNLAAAEALVPIYRAGEKWPRLLALHEIL